MIDQEHLKPLYRLFLNCPELKPSAVAPFATREDFETLLRDERTIPALIFNGNGFLVAGAVARIDDIGVPAGPRTACLIWIAVRSDVRDEGYGRRALGMVRATLKARGVTTLYAWSSSSAQEFFRQAGFAIGEPRVYVEAAP